ncbi:MULTISPECIES: hypothetical protein [unclassified Ensifer]|uniref:hypothetical protein n=1 Tax=unclassified Ensifer TaxID=2633371 RepID=UPI000813A7A7|nr:MULTISPECIES: hypothetical protein [unclassified Ensifer]OCP17454.1 hypothetical protein BC361_08335 [Ensifer sp. LC54]OCP28640.1 hypothetical protein BC363_02020 [Ensifer sp. LC384]
MTSTLPGLLGDIADIVGPEVALAIAQSHGGTRVAIPPRAEPGHWLTELVGEEVADKICRGLAILEDGRLKGVRSEVIPLGPSSVLKQARRRAHQALTNGASAREAARHSGLHERTIWRMKAKTDDDQGSLF